MDRTLVAISAVISALAALSIVFLTCSLVGATKQYVAETAKYVHLVKEQLDLFRAQLAAPLLLDVSFVEGLTPQLTIRCRHAGNSSSLPIVLESVDLQLVPRAGQAASEQHSLSDFLNPGRAWGRSFSGATASAIGRLPSPNSWHALFGRAPKQTSVAVLTVTLNFKRAQEPDSVTRDYEVRKHYLRGRTLAPL